MSFQSLDIFGISIGLRYLTKEEYQSKFGSIMTIIIGLLICIQIVIVGQELFLKSNPEVISAERYVAFPERFYIKNDTFNFAIGAQFPKNFSHFIDESIYSVNADLIKMTKVLNQETGLYTTVQQTIPIGVHPCTKNDFGVKETKDYFYNLSDVDKMYCLEQSGEDAFIEGSYDQESLAFIQIYFKICKDKPNCRKQTEIAEILKNSFVAIYMNDVIVNSKSFNPYNRIARDFYWSTSPENAKDVYMYHRNIYVESDNGILFKDISENRATSFSYQEQNVLNFTFIFEDF